MTTNNYASVKERIEVLDLEPIKFKMAKEHGYAPAQIEVLERWYKRFLFLTFKYKNEPTVVAEAIDAFWHQHILDTRKYAADCAAVFGEFLHHFPYFGLRGEDDARALRAAYMATLQRMREEYGDTPERELGELTGINQKSATLPSLCSD